MNVHNIYEPFPHIIVDNFLDFADYDAVFHEILALHHALKGPDKTSAASKINENNEKVYIKSGSGIFIENVYTDRNYSRILNYYNKIFTEDFYSLIDNKNWFYKKFLPYTNTDNTLLQSYGDGDYYDSHNDTSLITTVLMVYKEPKEFEGGELAFPEYNNYFVELKNNQLILFPSRIEHEVLKIHKSTPNIDGNRFTITKLIGHNY